MCPLSLKPVSMKSGTSGLLRRERETLKQFLTESKSPGCLTPGKPAKKSEKSALRQPVNLGPAEQSAAPALPKPQDIVVPSARLRRKALRKTEVEPGTKVRKKRVPEETCLFRAACCVRAGAAQEPGLIPRTEPADAERSDRSCAGGASDVPETGGSVTALISVPCARRFWHP